jgi:hypothetical protein
VSVAEVRVAPSIGSLNSIETVVFGSTAAAPSTGCTATTAGGTTSRIRSVTASD